MEEKENIYREISELMELLKINSAIIYSGRGGGLLDNTISSIQKKIDELVGKLYVRSRGGVMVSILDS